jgi:tRNA A37 threonylcarbamoyladenosine biosynthesis protein TsaE
MVMVFCVIEWPNYIDYLLPKNYIAINILPLSKNKDRLHDSNDTKNDEVLEEVKKFGLYINYRYIQ